MGNIIPLNTQVPDILRDFDTEENDALSSGLSGGFGVLTIRGGKFHIKYGGEEELVRGSDDEPKMSLEVVLLKASPHVAKTYYKESYVQGSEEEPDCFSLDGEKPSDRAPLPQSKLCSICPQNVFGSRISGRGSQAKACGDSRRAAVVPAGDIVNEQFGGPLLLRVPTMSLGDLGTYGRLIKAKGFPYNSIVTRMSFDTDVEYPKLKFKAARPLNDEEAQQVLAHLQSEKVETVLFEAREVTAKTAKEVSLGKPKPKSSEQTSAPTVDVTFDDEDAGEDTPSPTLTPKSKKKSKKKMSKKKVSKGKAPEEPPNEEAQTQPAESSELDDELDAIFASMDD